MLRTEKSSFPCCSRGEGIVITLYKVFVDIDSNGALFLSIILHSQGVSGFFRNRLNFLFVMSLYFQN